MEGYGRSDKSRNTPCDIENGADDLAAATDYMQRTRGVGAVMAYGISSGALRAALFAQRHPERVARLRAAGLSDRDLADALRQLAQQRKSPDIL